VQRQISGAVLLRVNSSVQSKHCLCLQYSCLCATHDSTCPFSCLTCAGFSACYAVPFYDGQLLPGAVRRLNLGGKALNNLLKETVSYRSLNMADEGLLMERLKDQLCWVSRVSQSFPIFAASYVSCGFIHAAWWEW
jgi:actin-related protein